MPGRWAFGADAQAPAEVEPKSSGDEPSPVTAPPALSPSEVEGRRRRIADALLQIEGAEFYVNVGRPDLARRYKERSSNKTAVRVAGGVVMAAGFVALIAVAVASTGVCDGEPAPCGSSSSTSSPYIIVPDLVMLGGLALLVAPAIFDTDPVSDQEKADLADAEAAARTRSLVRRNSLSFAPRLEHDGAALTFSGRF